ncbi:MAG: hypothetical protein JW733_03640 [Coriobacteriia bacterium]|nr:hypothetical protein [Coriobacteriia bacterium]MBN2839616.1 hypothetical protein [Coriobacteriia bacterium]
MARIRSTRTVWTGAIALGAVLLAVISVTGSSPAACAACHSGSSDGLAATEHADLTCYSCHAPSPGAALTFKASELLRMYPAWVAGGSVEGEPSTRMADRACRDCHSETVQAEEPVVARGLRIDHASCAADGSCLACHSIVGHADATRAARGPSMGACVDCHANEGVSITCETCHVGGYERNELLRGSFRVTHGSNWKSTHGMGDLRQCVLCHQAADCVSCHGVGVPHPADFGTTHGATSLRSDAECASCHRETFCSDCHGIEMPHEPEFLPEHPDLTTGLADDRCLRCHTSEDCDRCHVRHIHPGGAGESR